MHSPTFLPAVKHAVFALSDSHLRADWLIETFVFIIVLVLIKKLFHLRQSQLWHETTRTALEKGQPIPQGAPLPGGCGHASWHCGFIWIAVGVGLYLVNEGDSRNWAMLPITVGAALLLASLISTLFQSSKP